MKTRTFFALIGCVSLALMTGSCGTSNGSASSSNPDHESVFRTQGRVLVGEPPRPASNAEVRLVDLAPGRFSPMGPTSPYEFADTLTKTNSAGRFTIEAKRSPRLQKAFEVL